MKTTNLRIPEKLHKALKTKAGLNRRSMNAEILRAVEFYLTNRTTGERMANVLFNVSQREECFTEDERRMMKALQTEWDDAK